MLKRLNNLLSYIIFESFFINNKDFLSYYFIINLSSIDYYCCINSKKFQNFINFYNNNQFFNFFLIDLIFIDLNNYLFFDLKLNQKINNLIYIFQDYIKNDKIFIKISFLNNIKDNFYSFNLKTISNKYPSSIWLEREIFDMFGLFFLDNKDLRRILTDYSFEGYPLRKNFPITGFFELFFNIKQSKILNSNILLIQELRNKNLINNW